MAQNSNEKRVKNDFKNKKDKWQREKEIKIDFLGILFKHPKYLQSFRWPEAGGSEAVVFGTAKPERERREREGERHREDREKEGERERERERGRK